MAQRVTVTLEDDFSGGPAEETVRFAFGGVEYEIDLSTKNATAFRKKLAPFVEHARKAGRRRRRQPGRTAESRHRSGDIRAWAKAQGIAVNERGRIPASVAGAIPSCHHTALTPVLTGLGERPRSTPRARPDAPQGCLRATGLRSAALTGKASKTSRRAPLAQPDPQAHPSAAKPPRRD